MERRAFINGLLAASAVVISTTEGRAATKQDANASEVPSEPAAAADPRAPEHADGDSDETLWALLSPLGAGDQVGLGWRLVDMTSIKCGACVLVLQHETTQREARVHLCRHAGSSRGVAQSQSVDFLLMNRGDGWLPTDESLARVLNKLAELARNNERAGVAAPETLLSHDARMRFYRSRRALL